MSRFGYIAAPERELWYQAAQKEREIKNASGEAKKRLRDELQAIWCKTAMARLEVQMWEHFDQSLPHAQATKRAYEKCLRLYKQYKRQIVGASTTCGN